MIAVNLDVRLPCPECGRDKLLPKTELAIGRLQRCEHCGAELYLSHYREYAHEPALWRLESYAPDEEDARTDSR
ncbi:MAG TPA: hypothetical protein VLG68_00515 [Gammaproteobacteria bacterium]|nr:hypothetical protein [Gammaproteobacteria bacterium]